MSTDHQDATPACDVRFGQVGLANVRVLANNPTRLCNELAQRVQTAPGLFGRTAVILDLGHLVQLPADGETRALLDAVTEAGMLPVALAYGSQATSDMAERLGLPVIAKFRDAFEQPHSTPAPEPEVVEAAPAPPDDSQTMPTSLVHDNPIRSGQQLYAQNRSLVVTASVANSAEVIADGCIHIYGALRGRALAGAQGDATARIFCSNFHAQLVSIAGQYRVFEELPERYAGQAVQCWLDNDKLRIDVLQTARQGI